MSVESSSSTTHRLRSNLSFGQKLYRKFSSLRSSRPAQQSHPPSTQHHSVPHAPERLRDLTLPHPDSIDTYHNPPQYAAEETFPDSTSLPSAYTTKRTHRNHRREESPSPPIQQYPPYALDSSPVETYQSKDITADRVANSLERIAKQTNYFDSTPADPDDVSPKEAVIPLIVDTLKQHVKDPKVVDRALTALRRFTVDSACREKIGQCGGIQAIVDAMRCHSLRVRIQTQACLALANLAFRCQQNKDAFLECDGLPVIVAALSIHKAVEHVQAWGCFAIRNLTNGVSDMESGAPFGLGAVEVLVNALELYPKSTVVQEQSLIALANIANGSVLGMERIRSVGGLQSLIGCLQNNSRSAALSEVALSCAMVMVADETNQRIFGSDGGIEAITAVLDEHRGHTGIAVKGCASFRQLAFLKENRDLLGRCGGIRTIITAMMDTAASSAETATVLLKALSNSTFDAMANKTLAGRLGAIGATLKLMEMEIFQEDSNVTEDACRVIRNLTDGVFSNHRLLIRNRGVSIVLDAARLHGPSSGGVAEHSVAIFVNLTSNRAVAGQVMEGSGDLGEVARSMRRAHPDNLNIERQVDDLLSIIEPQEEPVSSKSTEWQDFSEQGSLDRTGRSSKSLRRSVSREGEQLTRLQRLRSLPLPLGRHNRVAV